MMSPPMFWRSMTKADLTAVTSMAAFIHIDYPEDDAVFAERLALFAPGCLIARDDEGAPLGYVIAHPGVIGHPPRLNSLLGALPVDADCLYLHDIALMAAARGRGLARHALDRLALVARDAGFDRLALTATPEAVATWRALGFVDIEATPETKERLASYGGGMTAMWRTSPLG